jgi:hypothetical protein
MTKREIVARVHAVAGFVAAGLIASFFVSSAVSELSGKLAWIVQVKRAVFYCMWAMVLLVPAAAQTGAQLAGKSRDPLVAGKRKRLRFIAPNGGLLLGLASYLYYKASHGELDSFFQAAQALEFAVGLTNLVLLGLMIRDGFRLKDKYRPHPHPLWARRQPEETTILIKK